jgi:hypothetical protein
MDPVRLLDLCPGSFRLRGIVRHTVVLLA